MTIEEMENSPLPDELVIAEQAKALTTEKDSEAKNETEEAPASEPEEKDEAEESTDDDESGDNADDESEEDADDAESDEADEQPVKKTRAERRRAKRAAMDRQRDAEHRRLQQELAELKATVGQKPASEASEDAPPKEEDFDDYSDFVAAKAEFIAEKKVEARLAAQKEQDQETAEQTRLNGLLATFEERVDAVRDKFEDYDEVVFDSSIQLKPAVGRVLLEMERGPELAYEIASSPKVQAKLSSLSETGVAIELGKMEAALAIPKARKATKAPDPVKPLRGKSTPVQKDAEQMSNDEYRAAREAGKLK